VLFLDEFTEFRRDAVGGSAELWTPVRRREKLLEVLS
jgi:hypothetical protein